MLKRSAPDIHSWDPRTSVKLFPSIVNNDGMIVQYNGTIYPSSAIYAQERSWLITSPSKTQDHPHDLLP